MKRKGFIYNLSPIQKILLSFIMLILTGTALLKIPFATRGGISVIDALFTSTSAVCVTGLIVLDTAKDFTLAGQCIILLLIQFGGLGIMTFSIAILSLIGADLSIKWRFTFDSFYDVMKEFPIKSLLKKIIVYTLIIEASIALALFSQFVDHFTLPQAIWHSIFQAVSAFCNAGFSTFSNSLMDYRSNYIVQLSIGIGIILGGLGFLVLTELAQAKRKRITFYFTQFTLHTKFVLLITGILIIAGIGVFLVLEWHYSIRNLSIGEKLIASFFQSVTCRTAGFNTVDIGSLRSPTLFVMMLLMFIGGSPGSIAGGIKTTTMGVIVSLIYSKFRGTQQIVFWGRSLNPETIERSTSLMILAILFITFSAFLLLTVDTFHVKDPFLAVLFEVTSAFGTVGLSTGITSSISDPGRVLMCLVMYIGRLGPLTLIMALTSKKKRVNIEYPEEHIMIG
jgi:trk system potassium uptake protein TrkH